EVWDVAVRTAGRGGDYQFMELSAGDSHKPDDSGGGGGEWSVVQDERLHAGMRGVDRETFLRGGISGGPGEDIAVWRRRQTGVDLGAAGQGVCHGERVHGKTCG